MANGIVSVHAGIYGMGIYAIMLPSRGFSVAYCGSVSGSFRINCRSTIGSLEIHRWSIISYLQFTIDQVLVSVMFINLDQSVCSFKINRVYHNCS